MGKSALLFMEEVEETNFISVIAFTMFLLPTPPLQLLWLAHNNFSIRLCMLDRIFLYDFFLPSTTE
jgi:hypothetical protein